MIKKNLIALCLCSISLFADVITIEEKLARLENPSEQEEEMTHSELPSEDLLHRVAKAREDLLEKSDFAKVLVEAEAPESEYLALLEEMRLIRAEIAQLEKAWQQKQSSEIIEDSEGCGIWENGEASVSELIIEYGSPEFLYIIPPDVANQKIYVHTAMMIPRASWARLLETIFKHNGIGVREINPYTKQLFVLKQDNISINAILSTKEQLELFESRDRIGFIFSPPVDHLKQAYYFIERFRDQKSTFVYQVGAKIAIVGFKEDIKRLVTLCDSVWEQGERKTVKVVTSSKIQSDEVVKLLKSYFGTLSDPNRSMMTLKGGHDLSVTPIAREGGVVLIGAKSLVERAEALIKEIEGQVSDPSELTVFWHTCSHSNPTDLAEILERVYASLLHSTMEVSPEMMPEMPRDPLYSLPFDDDDDDDDDLTGPYAHQLEAMKEMHARKRRSKAEKALEEKLDELTKPVNFIPYPTTGSILMVIRKDMVSKIKEVIKRLDIPKRMVEIEVLLVERRLKNNSRSGINILRIGSTADNVNKMAADFHGEGKLASRGLFEFIFSGAKNEHFPAIDLSYNFLLSQEDIRVTAAPSVITTNQTPAVIAVTDQISINNGASPVETNKGFVFKESFERADFGITIKLTPTIHEPEISDPDEQVFVTLENDIAFETINTVDGHHNNKPDVHKRQVKNQVRIADGQTVILGGLKNKTQEDKNDRIPFLGEIPGFGKLFGSNVLTDSSGEMFIFIKPKVIHDPKRDLILLREEKLKARPGDSQLFLDKIAESRKRTQERTFKRSFDLIIGAREDGTTNL